MAGKVKPGHGSYAVTRLFPVSTLALSAASATEAAAPALSMMALAMTVAPAVAATPALAGDIVVTDTVIVRIDVGAAIVGIVADAVAVCVYKTASASHVGSQ